MLIEQFATFSSLLRNSQRVQKLKGGEQADLDRVVAQKREVRQVAGLHVVHAAQRTPRNAARARISELRGESDRQRSG
jgi:hypothetical protein